MSVFSGIWDRLLINSQNKSRKTSSLQTVRIERSPCKYLFPSLTLSNAEFCLIKLLFVGTVSAFMVRYQTTDSPVEQVLLGIYMIKSVHRIEFLTLFLYLKRVAFL